jgi:hypothetical protein
MTTTDDYTVAVRNEDGRGVRFYRYSRCRECGRKFDMTDDTDAAEWHYGHDCEA